MSRFGKLALRGVVATAAMLAVFAPLNVAAEVPDWVPEKYRGFFVRHVDERPVWERALNQVDVELGETGRSFALIAGVSQYPNMKGVAANLYPAAVDVAKLTAYLASEPESFNEIVVLTEADVTARNLRYFLTNYFPQRLAAAPRSRFLFAYSGHGMTTEWGEGFLLTSQARNLQDRFGAGVSLNELRVWFQAVVREGHQVLALINACYGGAFHKLTAAFGRDDSAIPRREGAHAITAGGTGELTWHDPSFGEGSVFFEAVFAALDGRADKLPVDGVVTIGELQTYLHSTVSSFTDERQNPRSGDMRSKGSPGGFFFLDRRRQVERKNVAQLDKDWWQAFRPPAVTVGAKTDSEERVAAIPVLPSAPDRKVLTWSRTYGGSGDDRLGAVVRTADRGFVLAGATSSEGAGGSDGWLIKVDAQGREQWHRTYGGSDHDVFTAIEQTADGGLVVTGTTYSEGAGEGDGWLVKFSADGQVRWRRTHGGPISDAFNDVAQTGDGGFAVAGRIGSESTESGWLIKVDVQGRRQWRRIYGDVESLHAIVPTADGGFALAGYTQLLDGRMVKVDAKGGEQWRWTHGGSSGNDFISVINAVALTSDGGFALVGETDSEGAGEIDGWLVKLDAEGTEQWRWTYGGEGYDRFEAVAHTADGGFVLAGDTEGEGGDRDGWLVRVDAKGGEQWRRTYGNSGDDRFSAVVQTADGGFVAAGQTWNEDSGQSDGWLIKVDRDGRLDDTAPAAVRAE